MTKLPKNDPNYPNPYSSGGHSEPLHLQTAGKRYRVRNDDGPKSKVWSDGNGKGLAYTDAHKLKEKIAGERKSKNPIVEAMSVPFPPIAVAAPVAVIPPPPPPAPEPVTEPEIEEPGDVASDVLAEVADLGDLSDADLDGMADEGMS